MKINPIFATIIQWIWKRIKTKRKKIKKRKKNKFTKNLIYKKNFYYLHK